MRLVVNIPTYCEAENIQEVIKQVLAQQKNLKGIDLHVLISDSHSPDGTAEVVRKISETNPKVHYLDVKERGLGIGVVKGHRFAIDKLKADILAQMDGDLSHDPTTLPEMVENIQKGYDLVNGSRLTKGGKNLLGLHRRIFSRGSAFVCKILWGTFNISEYTNSYRVFTKKLFQSIDFKTVPWRAQSYIIQPAFLYAAIKTGAKIKEVPITFKDRKNGYSKAKIVSYILDVFSFGAKVRLERSKVLIKFLIVGTVSYFLSAVTLGLLNRGEIYLIPFLSLFKILSLPYPLLSFIPDQTTSKFLFLNLNRLFISSLISIELAIIFNFVFHENWTFKSRAHNGSIIKRFLKFNFSSISSPIIQIITIQFFVHSLGLHEQAGLAVGVLLGLSVNYIINILWIWKA